MSPALTRRDNRGFSTRSVHDGSGADAATNAVIESISLSAVFKQDAIGVHKGYEYGRSGNPNRDSLERLLSSIEAGGSDCVTFSSGSAATATMLQSLGANAHIISMNCVYGGTFRYMTRVAAETQGLETTFMDLETASEDEVLANIKENTKLIWIESPTNPTLSLVDIPKIVSVARSHPTTQPLVLVDNTFLSPYFSSPLIQGADIVLHSLTKYINGHSDVIMGALIFPAHHSDISARLHYLQNASGAVPSPHDCWLAQRGVKTLQVRMRTHGENALEVAKWLESDAGGKRFVKEVIYPGLKSHPLHDLAERSLSHHAKKFVAKLGGSEELGGIPYGGMVSFRIRGGEKAAERFLARTRLFTLAESLGGVESLAEAPARMTHASIPEEDREAAGITSDLVRLSVGIEDVEDLIEDIRQSLDSAVELEDVQSVTIKQAQHAVISGHVLTAPLA